MNAISEVRRYSTICAAESMNFLSTLRHLYLNATREANAIMRERIRPRNLRLNIS